MVTDRPPQRKKLREQFEASDRRVTLDLPVAVPLQTAARGLEEARKAGDQVAIQQAGRDLLVLLARNYEISVPALQVLGVRPHRVYGGHLSFELFGDYTPDTTRIRVWMRTAIQGKVTSYRGLLNTLLHEFCHHLDIKSLGFDDTPHTRGFYARIDELYHLALDTPAHGRKPLVWRKRGNVFMIDWTQMRARSISSASDPTPPGQA